MLSNRLLMRLLLIVIIGGSAATLGGVYVWKKAHRGSGAHRPTHRPAAAPVEFNKHTRSVRMQFLHQEPAIGVARGYISPTECKKVLDYIANSVTLVESKEVVPLRDVHARVALLSQVSEPLLMELERRIAELTLIPLENQEPFVVLRYEKGDSYDVHSDVLPMKNAEERLAVARLGGQRVVTVICLVEEAVSGGEVSFPRLRREFTMSLGDCMVIQVAHGDGAIDQRSVHLSLPVTNGTKTELLKFARENTVGQPIQRNEWKVIGE